MAGTIAPFPKHQFFTNTGLVAAGYQLFTYTAGTTTKLATYTDSDLTAANTNPIVLDSAGRATIFLKPTSYKFVLAPPTDTDPPASPVWTVDNASAVPPSTVDVDVTGTYGETIAKGEAVYCSEGDGSRTIGRWYKTNATLAYACTTAKAVGFATVAGVAGDVGTVRIAGRVTGLAGLSAGSVYRLSDTAGAITTSVLALRRRVGYADSATSLIVSHWLPVESPLLQSYLTTVGNIDTGEDILATYTFNPTTAPEGVLWADNMSFAFLAWGHYANNANAKTLRVRAIEGANNNIILSMSIAVSEAGDWIVGGRIARTGAATARAAAQAQAGPSNSPVSASSGTVSQPTLTWANSVEFRITGEATTTNDITLEGGYVTIARP